MELIVRSCMPKPSCLDRRDRTCGQRRAAPLDRDLPHPIDTYSSRAPAARNDRDEVRHAKHCPDVAAGFGQEWSTFRQSENEFTSEDREAIFQPYFHIFPWNELAPNSVGIDVGCGSGR